MKAYMSLQKLVCQHSYQYYSQYIKQPSHTVWVYLYTILEHLVFLVIQVRLVLAWGKGAKRWTAEGPKETELNANAPYLIVVSWVHTCEMDAYMCQNSKLYILHRCHFLYINWTLKILTKRWQTLDRELWAKKIRIQVRNYPRVRNKDPQNPDRTKAQLVISSFQLTSSFAWVKDAKLWD